MSSFTIFFFFNDTATTEIYTLSLHDALPISPPRPRTGRRRRQRRPARAGQRVRGDRKSTRLNSSHSQISYAVFCLKKKKKITHSLAFVSYTSKRYTDLYLNPFIDRVPTVHIS